MSADAPRGKRSAARGGRIDRRYTVEVLPLALGDIEAIHAYISLDSLVNASNLVLRLHDAIAALERFPSRWPVAPESKAFSITIRSCIVARYRVLFTIQDARVLVLRVRHGSRDFPDPKHERIS